MGWLRATYLTVGSFINFLFAIALVASAYAYIIPPDKMIFASYLGLAFPVLLAANIIFILFWTIQRHHSALISIIALIACWNGLWNYTPIHIESDEAVTEGEKLTLLTYNVHNLSLIHI